MAQKDRPLRGRSPARARQINKAFRRRIAAQKVVLSVVPREPTSPLPSEAAA